MTAAIRARCHGPLYRPEILAISGTIEPRDPDTHPGGGAGGAASPLLRGERWHSVLPFNGKSFL
jgi:hypothetical protein